MTTRMNQTIAHAELNDNELDAVIGGKHQGFHYETMNGHTYAIGHIHGQTVIVRVD